MDKHPKPEPRKFLLRIYAEAQAALEAYLAAHPMLSDNTAINQMLIDADKREKRREAKEATK